MNAMQQCLNVYNKAKANVAGNVASPQDEVIVALWELTQDQESTISTQAYKISVLESQDSDSAGSTPEVTALLGKISKGNLLH